MNIVMVGARAFPVIKAAVELAELLATFDKDKDVIHSRGGDHGTDAFIIEAAKIMGFETRRWAGEGGASNYVRDVNMVKVADVVYAFFEAESIGEGGTQHVVDKGLDQRKSVRSYTWDGRLSLLGSVDAGDGDIGPAEGSAGWLPKIIGEDPSEPAGSGGEAPQGGRRSISWGSAAKRE
jgi:hypothetical protein